MHVRCLLKQVNTAASHVHTESRQQHVAEPSITPSPIILLLYMTD